MIATVFQRRINASLLSVRGPIRRGAAAMLRVVTLLFLPACATLETPAAPGPGIVGVAAAAGDSAEIRAAVSAHYQASATDVRRRVTIRSDTSWATVYHGRITFTIVRLERRGGRWQFVREEAHGIH
jgi:hypothetical protein